MAGEHVPQKTEVGRNAAETMDVCLDTGDRVDQVQGGYKNDENQPSKVINSNLDKSQATDLDIPQLKGKRCKWKAADTMDAPEAILHEL